MASASRFVFSRDERAVVYAALRESEHRQNTVSPSSSLRAIVRR
jgi:hypothetical protein